MTKTRRTKFLNGTQLLRFKKFDNNICKDCNVEIKVGDDVTESKPFVNKGFWIAHHTECWEKKLQ